MSAVRRFAGFLFLCRIECGRLLGSRRFQGLSACFVLVMAWASVLALGSYRHEREEQRHGRLLHRQEIDGITIDRAASTWLPAWKTPWALAFVVDGGQASAPNLYRQQLTTWEKPRLERTVERNPRLPGVLSLDWMFALSSILFLACCLELYDSIGGERHSGRLRVAFSYALTRRRYLLAKLLSGWLCFSLPLLVGIAASLAVSLGAEPEIATPENLAKVGGVALLGLWGVLLFVCLSLLASLSARDPVNGLVALLVLWLSWVVLVPALAVTGARRLVAFPVETEISQRSDRISQLTQFKGGSTAWRKRDLARGDELTWERRSADLQNLTYQLQEELRREVLLTKIDQARRAGDLAAVFSPPALVEWLAVRLCGTGPDREEAFLRQAWEHRKSNEARISSLDAEDPQSPHLLFFTGYMSERLLPERALSEFIFRERTFQEGISASWTGLAGLALETLVLLVVTFVRFERYDLG